MMQICGSSRYRRQSGSVWNKKGGSLPGSDRSVSRERNVQKILPNEVTNQLLTTL